MHCFKGLRTSIKHFGTVMFSKRHPNKIECYIFIKGFIYIWLESFIVWQKHGNVGLVHNIKSPTYTVFVVLNKHMFLIDLKKKQLFMRIVDNKKNVSYPWQPFLCFGIYQHKNFSAADVNRLGITF